MRIDLDRVRGLVGELHSEVGQLKTIPFDERTYEQARLAICMQKWISDLSRVESQGRVVLRQVLDGDVWRDDAAFRASRDCLASIIDELHANAHFLIAFRRWDDAAKVCQSAGGVIRSCETVDREYERWIEARRAAATQQAVAHPQAKSLQSPYGSYTRAPVKYAYGMNQNQWNQIQKNLGNQ